MARSRVGSRWILWVALVAGAIPGAGRAAVPVGLYPVQADGLTEGERTEVQAVVESALAGADRRGVLEPRSPLVVPAACKPPITVGCVATQAKGGVILYARAKRRGAQILVTVLFVDAAGRKTRAAAFPVDLFIQNLRPANDAIATIEGELASGALEDPAQPAAPARPAPPERPRVAERPSPPPAPRPAPVRPPPPERPEPAPEPPPKPPPAAVAAPPAAALVPPAVAEAPPVPKPQPEAKAEPKPEPQPAPEPKSPSPPAAAAAPPAEPPVAAPAAEPAPLPGGSVPIDLTPLPAPETARPGRLASRPAERERAPGGIGGWRRTAAAACAGSGAAMIVAGVVVGLTGKRLADTLEDRYDRGALRPDDARLYDRVDRLATVANVLFVAGGLTTAAGLTFYALAPSGGGAGVAVAGSF